MLFVTGGGMTPAQASARNMETHGSLLKWAQVMATPGASPVTSTRELESKCLKKERCALVMKAGPLEVCACVLTVCLSQSRRRGRVCLSIWSRSLTPFIYIEVYFFVGSPALLSCAYAHPQATEW